MEFKIDKTTFVNALRKLNGVISARTVVPVLSGVHIIADNKGLVMTASDSSVTITEQIADGITVIQAGSIVLPAKELTSISRSMPDVDIKIKVSDKYQSIITSGKSKFTLNGVNPNDYPELPKVEGEGFTMKAEDLANLIEKTAYAIAKSEARPNLTGVNLFFEGDKVGMVATDSHRLAKFVGGNFEGKPLEEGTTIPGSALKVLPALLKNKKEVNIIKVDNNLVIETDSTTVLSRLLNGSYPDTDRLIPISPTTFLTVDRQSFLSSIERASILADNDFNTVTFDISGESNGIFETIELTHSNNELGNSKEDIIVNGVRGEEMKISFQPVYMMDALKRMDQNDIVIEFNGSMRPFVIKPNDRNVNSIQLILPVRTY